MHPILSKTLGGLNRQYYFRQLFFGAIIGAVFLFAPKSIALGQCLFVIVTTLLYPYARFVYESIVNFIVGNNVFIGNAILMLSVKMMTMVICWAMAIFIAPVGLAYLYFSHSKVH